jgi:hypothetical protein
LCKVEKRRKADENAAEPPELSLSLLRPQEPAASTKIIKRPARSKRAEKICSDCTAREVLIALDSTQHHLCKALDRAELRCGDIVWIYDEDTKARGLRKWERMWKVLKAKITHIDGDTYHLKFGKTGSWTYPIEELSHTEQEAAQKMEAELNEIEED